MEDPEGQGLTASVRLGGPGGGGLLVSDHAAV